MKKKFILLLSTSMLFACSSKTDPVEKTSEEQNKAEETEVIEEVFQAPDTSQITEEFPWEDEEDFQQKLSEYDDYQLITGYATVFEETKPAESENVRVALETMKGKELDVDEIFSQNDTAGPYSIENGYEEGTAYVGGQPVDSVGGGVCRVSSTLYNVAIASNLEIIERHNHSMPVAYVPYGQDAAVASDYKDFKFKNTTNDPLFIWGEFLDNRLYIAFYGKEKAPEVTWEHEVLDGSEVESTTQYIQNDDLEVGEEETIIKGMDGKTVHSSVKIIKNNGEEAILDLGNSIYNPLPTLVEINEE